MEEGTKRLFVGLKITKALQDDLANPAPGTKQYFEGTSDEYLQIINLGEEKFIGRYVKDGFPAANIGDVSRNVCSLVKLITRGRRIEENEVHIYAC
ncbi:MAG: hypothetical protein ACM3N3_05585 [Betaproteobacteria bacterium]|jgi:hypothetical protein|nr:hypothetical protein [Candidatus Binatia bacterium]